MRILVISDTHGRIKNFRRVIRRVGHIDTVMHLGDICGDDEDIEQLVSPAVACLFVRGNCDTWSFSSRHPDTREVKLKGHVLWMQHDGYGGHSWNAADDRILVRKAKDYGADIFLTGHTHVQHVLYTDGVWLINPGSLTQPRDGGDPSYVILDLNDDGTVNVSAERLPEEED